MRERLARALLAQAIVLGAACSVAWGDATLLADTPSVEHETTGPTRLAIRGVSGTISLRLGPSGALRFEGRSLDAKRDKRSAALWLQEDRTLLIGPGADTGPEGMLLDLLIPPEVKVTVEAAESKVIVGGMQSDLEVVGEKLEVRLRGVLGGVKLDLVRSEVHLEGVNGLVLGADQTVAEVKYVYGVADVNMIGGRLQLEGADELDAYLEGVDADVRGVKGLARVEALGGKLVARELRGGAEVKLEETPFELRDSAGDTRVETDAPVVLQDIEGPLIVQARGTEIKGGQFTGPLRVEADSASIVLEELGAPCEIHGSALMLRVVDAKEALTILTVGSNIEVKGALKAVTIENEFGDVEVTGSKGLVEVKSNQGVVRGIGIEGPMNVTADGPAVEVSWVHFGAIQNSTLINESGDLRVLVPQGERCLIEASAPHGRVESVLSTVTASDDGHSARGEHLGGGSVAPQVKKPMLQLTSKGGNVYLGVTGGE